MPKAKQSDRRRTWLELAIIQGGFRNATKAITWAYLWAVAREALGHDPSVEEAAEWWNESRRSGFRGQAAWRACFPNLDTPAVMFESPEVQERIREVVAGFEELEKSRRSGGPSIDTAMLKIGMLPATMP